MDIDNVKKIEELKSIGSITDVIELLNQKNKPFKVDGNVVSYESLLPYTYSKRAGKVEEYVPSKFFVSKKHEYIYYLTQHGSGKERLNKLGFKEEFLDGDKKEFKRWYKRVSIILEANSSYQVSNDDITKQAFQKLESIKGDFGIVFDNEDLELGEEYD